MAALLLLISDGHDSGPAVSQMSDRQTDRQTGVGTDTKYC